MVFKPFLKWVSLPQKSLKKWFIIYDPLIYGIFHNFLWLPSFHIWHKWHICIKWLSHIFGVNFKDLKQYFTHPQPYPQRPGRGPISPGPPPRWSTWGLRKLRLGIRMMPLPQRLGPQVSLSPVSEAGVRIRTYSLALSVRRWKKWK